jgi:VCBS repeat protein
MRVAANALKLGAVIVVSTTALAAGLGPPSLPGPTGAPWQFLDGSNEIVQTTASRFRAATSADFDGDGDNDVVVSAAMSAAGIDGTPAPGALLMNEGGRFVDRTAAFLPQLATPQVRWWSVAADFSGPAGPPDGRVDLFVAGGQGESSRLFMNRGLDASGNFLGFQDASSRLVNSPITGITHSYTARSGDFNGDGLADLLVLQYKSNSGVGACSGPYASNCFGQSRLLINSNGTLVDETATRLPARNEPSLFGQVADFNGDGYTDIALVNLKNGLVPQVPAGVPSIRVLINDGTGHFQTGEQVMPERLVPQSSFGTYSLDAGDFNKDGRVDIFVINWGVPGDEARDGVLLNLGSGNQLFPGGTSGIAYPIINAALDDDGDHPTAADLDGDGDMDVVVAQFATRPYFLMNESRGRAMVLRESTPTAPTVPNAIGFRNMVFDANADGVPDVWLALRDRNFLTLGNLPESEPNQDVSEANPTTTFPSLRTGIVHIADEDVFSLPAATSTGARIRLRPAPSSDLRLRILDASGASLFVSETAGNGGAETIDLVPGSGGAFARVELQGAQAGGVYRLEILRPGSPLTEEMDAPSPATSVAPVRSLDRRTRGRAQPGF